jgi:hypothetical protein
MGEIRVFEEAHISEVATLQLKILRRQPRPAGNDLQQYLGDILLRNPWRSDDLPSLVYIHQSKIVGFLGVVPRPMVYRGRPLRIAVATQFMVDRDVYRGFAGLELLKRFFAGPQDVSYTDGATDAAHATWTAIGAHAARLFSLEWTRILRPMQYARGMLAFRKGKWSTLARVLAPAGRLTDAGLSMVPLRLLAVPVSEYSTEETGADGLLAVIQKIGWHDPLHPAYELESFRWLIQQTTDAHAHGTLRLGIVRHGNGDATGWYAYFAKRGGISVVMQLGAQARHFNPVFQALLRDAWHQGSAALRGQAIPRHLSDLTYQHCGMRYVGSGALVHTRDPELLGTILRGDAALSRLDGEWWMRFAVADWM